MAKGQSSPEAATRREARDNHELLLCCSSVYYRRRSQIGEKSHFKSKNADARQTRRGAETPSDIFEPVTQAKFYVLVDGREDSLFGTRNISNKHNFYFSEFTWVVETVVS